MTALALQMALWPFGRSGSRNVPLGRRLHAWWNGYDLRDPSLARRRASGPGDAGDDPGSMSEGARSEFDQRLLTSGWSDTRLEVAEGVWTPGFIVPGGTAYVEELVGGCTLTAAETLLEINIGTGGGTRTIIGRFGNYVTAFEAEEALAREARSQAIVYDLDSKLDIRVAPYESLDIKQGYFRAALMREALFLVEDKEMLLEKVCRGLKEGESHLIITDFLFDEDSDDPALRTWIEGEGRPVYPLSLTGLKAILRKYKLKIRMEEEETERYCTMVTEAWAHYLNTMRGAEVTEAVGQQAMAEAAYWARRVAALKSGALRYYVIKAIKSS